MARGLEANVREVLTCAKLVQEKSGKKLNLGQAIGAVLDIKEAYIKEEAKRCEMECGQAARVHTDKKVNGAEIPTEENTAPVPKTA
jgi:hypothetical protein